MMITKEEKQKVIDKAKKTEYKHAIWSLEHMGINTVYGFMQYAAEGNGMHLDLKPSIESISDIPEVYEAEQNTGSIKELYSRQEMIELCIKHGAYKSLIIRSDERGSDRGILKIKTYLILKGLV